MKLDRLIQKIIPHDDKFFAMFEEATENALEAVRLLKQLSQAKSIKKRDELVEAIRQKEQKGDSVTHKIFSELNATFVTPLDREDIHLLGSAIDDILDHVDGTASRFKIYGIRRVPASVTELVDVLERSISEVQRGVGLLRDLHHVDGLQEAIQKVNEYENDADAIFDQAVGQLFAKEKSPIQLIKLKEVFVGIETATDKCEDAANVLEAILIKHA